MNNLDVMGQTRPRTVNKSTSDNTEITLKNIEPENPQKLYETLKRRVIINTEQEILAQIETIKALREIKEKELYKHDEQKLKSFSDFIAVYKVSRTQTYRYLAIAEGLYKNLFTEEKLSEIGFKEAEKIAKEKLVHPVNKSKQGGKRYNPNKAFNLTLRFKNLPEIYEVNADFKIALENDIKNNFKKYLKMFNL